MMTDDSCVKKNTTFTLSVKDSKAIASATICLDQITVLAGVNASGKSTIAKMMHLLVNLSSLYPIFANFDAWDELHSWGIQIIRLKNRLDFEANGLWRPERAKSDMEFSHKVGVHPMPEVLKELEDFTREVFDDYARKQGKNDSRRAFAAFLRGVDLDETLAEDVLGVWKRFEERVVRCQQKIQGNLKQRVYEVYNQAVRSGYDVRWLTDVAQMSFKEGNDVVYAVQRGEGGLDPQKPLKEIFGLKEALYIASPWVSIPTIEANGVLKMDKDELPHPVMFPAFKPDQDLFSALGGEVDIEESGGTRTWMYKPRAGGKPIELDDCATGMKALAILDILYSRGYLNEETLLIIDEPEAHLHPQWIVEYARILVTIAKTLKVRMLLTSHSPDMVAALQKIADVEGVDGIRFYVSEAVEDAKGRKFSYRDLGKNIEPIFDMFNVAMDRIDSYERAGR